MAGEEVTPRVARTDPRFRSLEAQPLPDFTDDDIASLCREIGAPLDPEHRDRLRKRLVEAGAFYRMSTDTYAETRGSQVLREARRHAKVASAFADLIEQMSLRTQTSAAVTAGKIAERYGIDWYNRMQPGLKLDESQEGDVDYLGSRAATQFLCDLKGVYRLEAVFSALARAPSGDKGGRVRDRAREGYLRRLAEIYEETTATNPRFKFSYDPETRTYWGSFFSFAKRNLDIVRPDHGLGNVALGSLIKRVLPKRLRRAERPQP